MHLQPANPPRTSPHRGAAPLPEGSGRLRKYSRDPARLPRRRLTERSLAALAAIFRYRFLPTSLACALLPGNARITKRHLQTLYHQGWVARFAFPGRLNPGEFHYYLDDVRSVDLLESHGLAPFASPGERAAAKKLVRNNRHKAYDQHHRSADRQGQLLFLQHEAALSRFHAALELGARATDGTVELATWTQGPALWQTVTAPVLAFDPRPQAWVELAEQERLPHRPDAFFTLRFPSLPPDDQLQSFFYEYERGTATTAKVNRKLRAHLHFILQKRHQAVYQVRRIRAVLVETPTGRWAETLRQAAAHPMASGRKPTELFWFAGASLLSALVRMDIEKGKRCLVNVPRFVTEPLAVWEKVWKTSAHEESLSLLDF